MGAFVACLAFGGGTLAAWLRMRFERNRAEREFVEAAAESAERRDAELAFKRRAAAVVELADDLCRDSEFAFEQQLDDVLRLAEHVVCQAEHEQGLLRFDDYADLFPMPQRPDSPPTDPAEPWQLNPKAGADE
jgi:hypothetical protein